MIIALSILALLLAAALLLALSRRRGPPAIAQEIPRLRHPVVLAHGLFGFDELAIAGRRHRYFRAVAASLDPFGTFHRPRLPAVGTIAARAEKLAALIASLPEGRVSIVAHSMGGLDARYAIAKLGLAGRVAALVTVGTPHHGTPLARLGRGLPAFRDLTPAALARFNEEIPDAPGVAYLSVVASSSLWRTNPLLWPGKLFLRGPNDGLVPLASQRWGRVLREIRADHWAQVGWSFSFDAVELYESILRELARLGF